VDESYILKVLTKNQLLLAITKNEQLVILST